MAANHTQNYQLNLWESTDTFLRTEFNENSQKLDAALGNLTRTVAGKADQSALDALAETANTKASTSAVTALTQTVGKKLEFASGTYVGTGLYDSDHPTSLDFAQATGGKPPLLVMVAPVNGNELCFWAIRGQKNAYVHDQADSMSTPCCHITWTNTGLSWYANYPDFQLNIKDATYIYMALF